MAWWVLKERVKLSESQNMKTKSNKALLLSATITVLAFTLACRSAAQSFTTLYSFTTEEAVTNTGVAFPEGSLILSGTTTYGTGAAGNGSASGAVFKLNADGAGFTTLYELCSNQRYKRRRFYKWRWSESRRSDDVGKYPGGVGAYGGSSGTGTLFKLNTDGTGFTNLHSFTPISPGAIKVTTATIITVRRPVVSGNTLYGTAQQGGVWGQGTVFKINTDGTSFTTLHSFTFPTGSSPRLTATEPRLMVDWSYLLTRFMERRFGEALTVMAQYTCSTRTERSSVRHGCCVYADRCNGFVLVLSPVCNLYFLVRCVLLEG